MCSLRLRTRLIAALLALLAVVCLVLGGLTWFVMRNELTQRVDEQLVAATGRVGTYRGGMGRMHGRGPMAQTTPQPTSPAPAQTGLPGAQVPGAVEPGQGTGFPDVTADDEHRNPINAPGLPPQTVTMVLQGDTVRYPASIKDESDTVTTLSDEDADVLRSVPADGKPVSRELTRGEYRLRAVAEGDSDVIVTGFSLADRDRTLSQQLTTMGLLSLLALALTGVIGTFLVRRELRPLEHVAGVATRVAAMPLDEGAPSIPDRVAVPESQRGTEVGTVGVALDQLLDSVQVALAARHASETRVRRFVADASHELRTPLAAIRGYAEMLRLREPLTDDGAAHLERVESQAVRMSRLVEDLLVLARLDEGRVAAVQDVDLGEVVLDAVTDARAAGRTHVWSLDLPEEPVVVRADAGQLGQVVANLLSNARKHTDPGTHVRTSLSCSGGAAFLTVADDGPGIPAEFLPHVFDRFARADAARSGGDGTTGLGLAIVHGLVAAQGGRITVWSRPGETVFEVRWPLAD